jgi:hypothetical protein
MYNSEGTFGCRFLYPYDDNFSEEARDEDINYWRDLNVTGVIDMTDSEHYVPEYISRACPSYKDEDGNFKSSVTYLISALTSPECGHDYYPDFDQLEYINVPQCACAECTDDNIIDIIQSSNSYYCESSPFQNITVTRVDYNIEEKSIVSID